jgi:hypothetical protein
MNKYELSDHRRGKIFRPVGGYFANFSGSVSRISEEIDSQSAVYLSYASIGTLSMSVSFPAGGKE